MINYQDIPFQYPLCVKGDCPSAATCMRHFAVSLLSDTQHSALLLLPHRCLIGANGKCTHYRPITRIRLARGFRRVLADFPTQVLDAFRDHLTTVYPRNKYFQMRRGDIPLSPEDQQRIIRTARTKGYKGDFFFDCYEEGYAW